METQRSIYERQSLAVIGELGLQLRLLYELFRIELESPIPHSTPLQMTTDLTRSLEVRVTADPGQWFWIHKRWK